MDKQKHKNLQATHTKLRAALRRKPKNGETVEAPHIYNEIEPDVIELNRENDREGEGQEEREQEEWGENVARALKQTRTNIRSLYRKHERRQAWKRVKHFRHLLRESPKVAHRYLFETGEKNTLEGVRTAAGEVVTSEKDLLKSVETHFAKQQRTRVPEGEARNLPWGRKRLKVDSTLIKRRGGSHKKLRDRF